MSTSLAAYRLRAQPNKIPTNFQIPLEIYWDFEGTKEAVAHHPRREDAHLYT